MEDYSAWLFAIDGAGIIVVFLEFLKGAFLYLIEYKIGDRICSYERNDYFVTELIRYLLLTPQIF